MSSNNPVFSPDFRKAVLLGNEAVARGLLEGGLQVAAAYPGTPSTEIQETLIQARNHYKHLYSEWSSNEKVATEVAIAGSLSGKRSMVAMKGVGLNVALEPLQAFSYFGVRGGFVLVVSDDPGMHSSHTEQDNRFIARQLAFPVLEPESPRKALELARQALVLSERWGQPVFLRLQTLTSHTRQDMELGEVPTTFEETQFERDPSRWINLPFNSRRMRKEQIARINAISEDLDSLDINGVTISPNARKGIVAVGVPISTVQGILDEHEITTPLNVFELRTPWPLPTQQLTQFMEQCEEVLVVEELEPFVEEGLCTIAHKAGLSCKIYGKEFVPQDGEVKPSHVIDALNKWLKISVPKPQHIDPVTDLPAPRPPTLCAGCGHRNVFHVMNVVARKLGWKKKGGFIKPGDVGCYTLGFFSPMDGVDTHFCMGASIGVGQGFAQLNSNPVVATIGDGTFFHAGMPALASAVVNNAKMTVIILDNGTTAMTGHQPHPGIDQGFGHSSIEGTVRGLGVRFLEVVDVFDPEALQEVITRAIQWKEGPAVVVARGPCVVVEVRNIQRTGVHRTAPTIDKELCRECRLCVDTYGCPAFYIEEGLVQIDGSVCNTCQVCSSKIICPFDAIVAQEERFVGVKPEEEK